MAEQVNRRKFLGVCAGYAAMLMSTSTAHSAVPSVPEKAYRRVLLERDGKPMSSDSFKPGQAYIFHYPYVTTPCLIFNLGESVEKSNPLMTKHGEHYIWPGGSGAAQSIVAYSAICAHQMTYPAKSASFLNYRHEKVTFYNKDFKRQERDKIIYCCSERSVYDPVKGAEVLGGPAPQPLTSIFIEHDKENDSFYALGTIGGELYEEFLSKFEFRLQLDFKVDDVRKLTEEKANVMTIEEFSHVVVAC